MNSTETSSLTLYDSEQLARLFWNCDSAEKTSSAVRDKSSTPDVRQELQQIANADIKDLSAIMQQLIVLRKSHSSDHRGVIRPVDEAFELVVQLLVDGSLVLRQNYSLRVPQGFVSPDFEGGLRIEWIRPAASVHLVIGPTSETPRYIYHEANGVYGVDKYVSPERLASWLRLIRD